MKLDKIIITILMLLSCSLCSGERIKDIADIQGVRGNPLMGKGLVVGLNNTGDTSLPSRQILTAILRSTGQVLQPDDLTGGNIAIVMVTAELGPFDRVGGRIDVDISSIGDAKSLQGGVLLATPLVGLDGEVYAVTKASGISLGGWSATGNQGSISKNHQTVARIPGGAVVERDELANFVENVGGDNFFTLTLRNADFTTASRMKEIIDSSSSGGAWVLDGGTVKVRIPAKYNKYDVSRFIDEVSRLEVEVDVPAVVVINEKTGTIVVGENVGISTVAISQGSLVVKINETAKVSQPNASFSDAGSTAVVPETLIGVSEDEGVLIPMPHTVTVSELANLLNSIGASPTDLIAIFNALKRAGALQARLEIM